MVDRVCNSCPLLKDSILTFATVMQVVSNPSGACCTRSPFAHPFPPRSSPSQPATTAIDVTTTESEVRKDELRTECSRLHCVEGMIPTGLAAPVPARQKGRGRRSIGQETVFSQPGVQGTLHCPLDPRLHFRPRRKWDEQWTLEPKV